MNEHEAFVPISKLADHLHIKVSTVREWLKRGYIPRSAYLKIGNTYRFHLSEVIKALNARSAAQDAAEAAATNAPPIPAEVDPNMPVQLELDLN